MFLAPHPPKISRSTAAARSAFAADEAEVECEAHAGPLIIKYAHSMTEKAGAGRAGMATPVGEYVYTVLHGM